MYVTQRITIAAVRHGGQRPDGTVERCLACEAVVSNEDEPGTSLWQSALSAVSSLVLRAAEPACQRFCLYHQLCSPRPRKRGSAPRLSRVVVLESWHAEYWSDGVLRNCNDGDSGRSRISRDIYTRLGRDVETVEPAGRRTRGLSLTAERRPGP